MFENKIKITAPFWQQYINLIREEMLPFQWSVLNDEADIKIEKKEMQIIYQRRKAMLLKISKLQLE